MTITNTTTNDTEADVVDLVTYSDVDLVQTFAHKTSVGVAISLVGYSMRLQARVRADDSTVFFECSTENGRIAITDAANGLFKITIPISVLSSLPPGDYVHSLIKTHETLLTRSTVWRGTLKHSVGPTRWELGKA